MSDIAGRFVFIPDDGSEALEIDLSEVLENAAEQLAQTPWERVKAFFQSFKKTVPKPKKVDLPQKVCDKLEELFSTAEWHSRDGMSSCYILDIYPRNHATGYEPMARVAFHGGIAHEVSVAELLTDYVPLEPVEGDMH